MRVKAKRITAKNFAKFGKVVTPRRTEPTSQAADYKFWSNIADYLIEGETEIGICTVYAQPQRQITGVERHFRTPEILIPIDAPFVLPLVKEWDLSPKVEAFRVGVGEVVVINNAVWHGACLPVGKPQSSYFVIFRKNTPFEDVEKRVLRPVEISA